METVLKAISDWLKSLLTAGIMSNLSGLFDDVNTQVGNIAQQVGTRPSAFEPRVFAMIEALSRNVVLPIAGIILTFIACYELIEMITQHNNMAQFEPALIMRWIFKTAVSVWFISNTFDIVMAVFDLTQKVVSDSSGIIAGNTRVNEIGLSMLEASLMQMDVGPLFGLEVALHGKQRALGELVERPGILVLAPRFNVHESGYALGFFAVLLLTGYCQRETCDTCGGELTDFGIFCHESGYCEIVLDLFHCDCFLKLINQFYGA